jgi:ADP-ribose pyrophosphatase YjhB (NUDIX family)
MPITQTFTASTGTEYLCEYVDADTFDNLPYKLVKQAYGVCFYNNDLVIGFGGPKKGWGLIGGSIEEGEAYEDTLIREIKEESNMNVIAFKPIGYQKVTDTTTNTYFYQLRYVCIVVPYGEFSIDGGDGISDKAITEIKCINPKDYKNYFDWGEIGDRVIERGIELRDGLTTQNNS